MTTPEVQQEERPPAGPWVIGQVGIGAVTAATAGAAFFGVAGLLIAGAVGALGITGLVVGRKQQQRKKGGQSKTSSTRSTGGGKGRRSGLFGGRGRGSTGSSRGRGSRGSGLLPGSRSRKGKKGAESGAGRKGKANGARSGGLLGRRKGRGSATGASSNGRRRGQASGASKGKGKGAAARLRSLFGGKGKGSQGKGSGSGKGKGKGSSPGGGKGKGGAAGRLRSWFGGKGKGSQGKGHPGKGKGKTTPTSPDGLTPPPVSTQRGETEAQRPGDEKETSGANGSRNGKTQDDASKTTGGNTREVQTMGRIADAGDSYVEAMRSQPLENAKDMETALADLAAAEEKHAQAKAILISRVREEFPAHSSIAEAIGESAQNQKSTASVMSGFKSLFQRKHQLDYERFEQPRTQEQKMDYRNNQG